MKNFAIIMKNSLLKKEEALAKFKERREAFLLAKGQITRDIEEARTTYKQVLEQLPKNGFNL
ncbi:MAG: hypothetical protein WCJ95_07705 [Mariniphaga sp.]